jgi:hypothetical protein
MAFNFLDLDDKTRRFMVEEVDTATSTGNLYFSKRFNEKGNVRWPSLLREAVADYTEHWLAYQIEAEELMKELEGSHTRLGGYTVKHVPHTAAETLADGQFNRFYILGVCRHALDEGHKMVRVYRAKQSQEPRPESDALIGTSISAQEILDSLRPVQSSLGHQLLKPNSGLSVQFPV